jgi:FtsP/CotA-like multicopper oxidase with cupredoxin domain/plastocyanin
MRKLFQDIAESATTRVLSRRGLIQAGAASSAGAVSAAVLPDILLADDEATPLPPATHELTLTASEFDWQLMDDVTVRVWGYNGQVPGPEIRVREGDLVRIELINELPVPTTIHWHGLFVPNAMDGVAGLNQAPVAPGESFTYEFVAKPTGTRWYHSHTDPAVQVPMGLYGAFIVEPNPGTRSYDREQTLIVTEWDLELTPGVAAGTEPAGPGDSTLRGGEHGADLFLINGKMHGGIPPIGIAEGETILLRLINAGAKPHPIHIHGHNFKVVATDGNPVPEAAQLIKDTVLIGPAERYDLELFGDNPGVWMVHCHIEHHMANGMMTTLWYDGATPTGPVAPAVSNGGGMHHHQHTDATPTPSPEPEEETPAAAADGDVMVIEMVDDRFEPVTFTVPLGTTVDWVNHGRNWHSIAAYDGSFESGRIEPGEHFVHQFTQVGEFKYICKHHGMQGMIGSITVQ